MSSGFVQLSGENFYKTRVVWCSLSGASVNVDVNARHVIPVVIGWGREVAHECCSSSAGVGRGRVAPSQSGWCAGGVVRRTGAVLPGRGQGPGQIRDVAGPCGRPGGGEGGGGGARLLAGRLLPGAGGLRRAGDGGAGGRSSWPSRQGHGGDRGVPGRRRAVGLGGGPGRGGGPAVRGEPASPHSGAGVAPVRALWPPMETAQVDY